MWEGVLRWVFRVSSKGKHRLLMLSTASGSYTLYNIPFKIIPRISCSSYSRTVSSVHYSKQQVHNIRAPSRLQTSALMHFDVRLPDPHSDNVTTQGAHKMGESLYSRKTKKFGWQTIWSQHASPRTPRSYKSKIGRRQWKPTLKLTRWSTKPDKFKKRPS